MSNTRLDALVIDNRKALHGKAGLHALITGLSHYPKLPFATDAIRNDLSAPHYGLRQLSSPALSAYRLARALLLWAPTLPVPIATIRLLLSPAKEEGLAEMPLARRAVDPTWDNFSKEAKAWREDAAAHPDNFAFLYFGGHGLQRYINDQILLLKDFGDGVGGPLNHGADSRMLVQGMTVSSKFPKMARRQLFLFDACRSPIPKDSFDIERENVRDIWSIYQTDIEGRDCAIFYATMPGASSYAVKGGKTVFARAFINAVNRVGADETQNWANGKRVWGVTAASIAYSIGDLIKNDPTPVSGNQSVFPVNASPSLVLRNLQRAPRVKFTIRLNPAKDHKRASLTLKDGAKAICETGSPPISPYPFKRLLQAGLYISELQLLEEETGKVVVLPQEPIQVHPRKDFILLDTVR